MRAETSSGSQEIVWSVSQLNRLVGRLLQSEFPRIWVRGEISNFTAAASGHWYFSIKDSDAMIRAVMFRGRAQASGLQPRVGDQFEFRGTVTLYEARGDYQLQVDTLRRAGRGDLYEAFLRLKDKLAGEGLFAAERKRVPPALPRAIGVVTSLAAAALRDVLTTLRRRAPHVPVIVYPAPVQGRDAAPQLVQAIETAIARAETDSLLLVRGGGSIEDLWSFNDEALARVIAASPIPIISGVGHETDFTISDFVADLRAPTPTAAAELVCLSRALCLDRTAGAFTRLELATQRQLERRAQRLDRALSGLVSPAERLHQQALRLQGLVHRLGRAGPTALERQQARFTLLNIRLRHCTPRLAGLQEHLLAQRRRLAVAAGRQPERARQQLDGLLTALHALGPRHTLSRGYAIVRDDHQAIIKNALDLNIGQTLGIEFDQGAAQVRVLQVHGLV